ncbi:hypothetical protein HMPREF9413_5494 [Paenibacillus sp. HGF7]|nr:hypothetical protein HMPREF9413_5494 [Paenibacillus sp. HGF7]
MLAVYKRSRIRIRADLDCCAGVRRNGCGGKKRKKEPAMTGSSGDLPIHLLSVLGRFLNNPKEVYRSSGNL